MRRHICILFLSFISLGMSAQNTKQPVKLSLWHPVSFPHYYAPSTNNLSISLFQSKVNNLSGLGINGLGSKITGKHSGVNVSGLYNHVQGDMKGVSVAGIVNINNGDMKGVSFASLLNMNLSATRGMQLSVFSNMSIGPMVGMQFTAGYNVASSEMRGMQFSAIGNITAKGSDIMQVSGVFNMSLLYMKGMQLAAGNFADTIQGVQLGLINVSSSLNRGVQIGLVNYSHEKTGLQIGLVNISRSSRLDLLMYGGNYLYANFAARIQNKHTFSIIGFGIPYNTANDDFSGGVYYRYGVRVPIKKIDLRPDIGIYFMNIFDDDNYVDEPMQMYSLQGRISLEYPVNERLRLFLTGGLALTSEYGKSSYKTKGIFEAGMSLFLLNFSGKK